MERTYTLDEMKAAEDECFDLSHKAFDIIWEGMIDILAQKAEQCINGFGHDHIKMVCDAYNKSKEKYLEDNQ